MAIRRKKKSAASSTRRTALRAGGDDSGLPKATQVIEGILRRAGERMIVNVGGLNLEVLTGDAPRGDAQLASARAATRRTLGDSDGQSVLIRGHQSGAFLYDAKLVTPGPSASEHKRFQKIASVIKARGHELLALPMVVGVRAGYRFRDGWITNEPCIVAVVRRKLSDEQLAESARVPAQLGGVPVDVAPAGPVAQLLAQSGRAVPHQVVANPLALAVPMANELEPEVITAEIVRKQTYVPPSDVTLDPVHGPMKILCHASPDAGWPTLEAFLHQTQRTLTVAMYDFTAPHIVRALEGDLATKGKLSLILDPACSLTAGGGGKNPKSGDWQEDEVRDDIKSKLKQRFAFTWAAVKHTGKTDAGIFPTAYHIKVAVSDSKAMWLSSGNWQSSNQPDIDPLGKDKNLPGVQKTYNREWHVTSDSVALSRTYEKFIEWDISQAGPMNIAPSREDRPDVLVAPDISAEAAHKQDYVAPHTVALGAGEQVQPLLTPDNYADHVITLIERAKKTLRFQNQYINIGKANPPKFEALLQALKGRIDAGVKVQIILRDIGSPRDMLEALKNYGINTNVIKLQAACHNKGIIVDDRFVAIGSHNWSGDGTCYNRDASLIFDNTEIAAYYAKIFDYDWNKLAKKTTASEAKGAQLAGEASAQSAAMTRIPWDAYFGEQRAEVDAAVARALGSAPLQPLDVRDVAPPRAASAGAGMAVTGDMRAAKATMTDRYLTSARAHAIFKDAEGISPVPEVNVLGVGIAEKVSEGGPTGVPSIKFLVRRKYARAHMSSEHMLPAFIDGFPTDVEEIGEVKPLALQMPDPRINWTPAQPGSSIGYKSPDHMAGTFGALVRDPHGHLYILSNNHVLANEGRLKAGAPIYQCGLLDLPTGQPPRQIARLTRFSDLKASNAKIDAAIAAVLSPDLVSPDILYIGRPQGTTAAATDMVVHKFGRTSDYKTGRVISTAMDIQIDYDTGTYTFYDQIAVESLTNRPFSEAGDSGSLILERATKKAVGLLFAGSPARTFANHIDDVLSFLGVTLV
jgi:hypothetical protein